MLEIELLINGFSIFIRNSRTLPFASVSNSSGEKVSCEKSEEGFFGCPERTTFWHSPTATDNGLASTSLWNIHEEAFREESERKLFSTRRKIGEKKVKQERYSFIPLFATFTYCTYTIQQKNNICSVHWHWEKRVKISWDDNDWCLHEVKNVPLAVVTGSPRERNCKGFFPPRNNSLTFRGELSLSFCSLRVNEEEGLGKFPHFQTRWKR